MIIKKKHCILIRCTSFIFFLNYFIYLFGSTRSSTWYFESSQQHENSPLQHVGSSSLTRDQTRTPCIGNMESEPLDHREVLRYTSLPMNSAYILSWEMPGSKSMAVLIQNTQMHFRSMSAQAPSYNLREYPFSQPSQ